MSQKLDGNNTLYLVLNDVFMDHNLLKGFTKLWETCLYSEINKDAFVLLNSLYTYSTFDEELNSVLACVMSRKYFDFILKSIQADSKYFDRSVVLINSYLDFNSKMKDNCITVDYFNHQIDSIIKLPVLSFSNSSKLPLVKILHVSPESIVGNIITTESKDVVFYNAHKKIDHTKLIGHDLNYLVIFNLASEIKIDEVYSKIISPKYYLANGDFFKFLFYHLSSEFATAWNLLTSLPINEDYLNHVLNINESMYKNLFEASDESNILYSLYVTEKCLRDTKSYSEWVTLFIKFCIFDLLDYFISANCKKSTVNAYIMRILNLMFGTVIKLDEDQSFGLLLDPSDTETMQALRSSLSSSFILEFTKSIKSRLLLKKAEIFIKIDSILNQANSIKSGILYEVSTFLSCLFLFENNFISIFNWNLIYELLFIEDEEISTTVTEYVSMAWEYIISNIVIESPKCTVFQILKSRLKTSSDALNTGSFFSLFNSLIDIKYVSAENDPLLVLYIDSFKECSTIVNSNSSETSLTGSIFCMNTILVNFPNIVKIIDVDKLTEILYSALYHIVPCETIVSEDGIFGPLCKSELTRTFAFDFMANLFFKTNSLFLFQKLNYTFNCNLLTYSDDWNYGSLSKTRQSNSFAGIQNLGCICYLISILQQLFMIKDFRQGVLNMECAEDANDFQWQLKLLFCNLISTNESSVNPRDFCVAYKDFDGNSIDLYNQQDSYEFYTLFCDKLSMSLTGKNFVYSCLGGTLEHQLLCKEDISHKSFRDESFIGLQLEVNGKKDVLESLQLYIDGETLEGNNSVICKVSKKKVSTQKRVALKKLPQVLVLNLKRFEYDFDTMEKKKINDKFTFQSKINLFDFTREGLDKTIEDDSVLENRENGYDYTLVGVLVHSGKADSGHFYSYIRERDTKLWFEFNDSNVSVVNSEVLANCFGGKQSSFVWNQESKQFVNAVTENSTSAYCLIYERRKNILQAIVEKDLPDTELSLIPITVFKNIVKRNIEFQKSNILYEKNLGEFMFKLAKHILTSSYVPEQKYRRISNVPTCFHPQFADNIVRDNSPDFGLSVCMRYFFEIFFRMNHTPIEMDNWLRIFQYNKIEFCSKLFNVFAQDSMFVKNLLLECEIPNSRLSFVNVLFHLIKALHPHESSSYSERYKIFIEPMDDSLDALKELQENDIDSDVDSNIETQYVSIISRFITILLDFMPFATSENWRKIDEYFYFLREFASIGFNEAAFLIRNHAVETIIDFFLGNNSPNITPRDKKRTEMGDKQTSPPFNNMVALLLVLVKNSKVKSTDLNPKVNLPVDSKKLLFNKKFLRKLIGDCSNPAATSDIISLISTDNAPANKAIMELLVKIIHEASAYSVDVPLFFFAYNIMHVNDNLVADRCNFLFISENNLFSNFSNFSDQCPEYCLKIIEFLASLIKEGICLSYFADLVSDFERMKRFLLFHTTLNDEDIPEFKPRFMSPEINARAINALNILISFLIEFKQSYDISSEYIDVGECTDDSFLSD